MEFETLYMDGTLVDAQLPMSVYLDVYYSLSPQRVVVLLVNVNADKLAGSVQFISVSSICCMKPMSIHFTISKSFNSEIIMPDMNLV